MWMIISGRGDVPRVSINITVMLAVIATVLWLSLLLLLQFSDVWRPA
jgi:hypothetical protein